MKGNVMENALERRQFFGVSGKAALGMAIVAAAGTGFVLEGCNVDWITTAINDLPTVVDIATTVATIVAAALGAGAIAPAVAAVIKTASEAAKVALAVVQQAVKDYQANPSASLLAKIKTTLLDIQGSLGQILDAAHIDNVALRMTITALMGLAITVLTQIMSLLPVTTVTAALKSTAQKTMAIKPTPAAEVRKQANGFLNAYGYSQYALQ
jgi:hypothetical protein